MHILLVDDDAQTLRAFRWLLTHKGHRVTTAATLADARAACDGGGADPFDLILCDLGLPDGDGRDLAEVARHCGTRAVAVTGYELSDADQQAAGFWAYLFKPIDLADVDALLGRAAAEPIGV